MVKKMSKLKKIIIRSLIGIIAFVLLLLFALSIYAGGAYTALEEMTEQMETLDISSLTIHEDYDEISYTVDDPIKNILFIPGGLVTPDSYSYLAMSLALEGYNVTIVKSIFYLAILSPNRAVKFIDDDLDNVIIGHSLGGIVASMVAAKQDLIGTVILLGSYPIKDITDKDTLLISAEFDLGMDPEAFDDSLQYVNDEKTIIDIEGGNHAQFGWYGPQKGDGEAEMSTLVQQDLVIQYILDYIN
jgi:hypothetical protein